MPSDPSGAQPKGTLVRQAADYFDDNLGVGGFFFTNYNVAPAYAAISLYNNANTGVALKVYAMGTTSDGGGGVGLYSIKGTFGALIRPCVSTRFDQPVPFGVIYEIDQAVASFSTASPFSLGPLLALWGSGGNNAASVFSSFPVFIVPVGYSLVASNTAPGGNIGASFWFQQANE